MYTPDKEALLIWFSLNRAVIRNKHLLLINPNGTLWEMVSLNCVLGKNKNLLDLVSTKIGTLALDMIYKPNVLKDTHNAGLIPGCFVVVLNVHALVR